MAQRFDRAFFARYYEAARTRVADDADATRVAALIGGGLRYLEVRVRTILDAGCGVGLLRKPLLREFRGARYRGLEVSEYACERYGWTRGSVVDYRPRTPFDLVVCHDVLQYLGDREAALALTNLAQLSRGFLYFSVLTAGDWRHHADPRRTDRNVHLRSADWYRRRLRRGFRHLGLGLHVRRDLSPLTWELEQPWR
jgi:predicted TPR repeat methyltransferase